MKWSGKRPRSPVRRNGSAWLQIPLLGAVLVLLVGCVTQRFCVDQLHVENRDLADRLDELRGEERRWDQKVESLSGRQRIESIASERFGLIAADGTSQIHVAAWTAREERGVGNGSIVASLFLSAGRGISQVLKTDGRVRRE